MIRGRRSEEGRIRATAFPPHPKLPAQRNLASTAQAQQLREHGAPRMGLLKPPGSRARAAAAALAQEAGGIAKDGPRARRVQSRARPATCSPFTPLFPSLSCVPTRSPSTFTEYSYGLTCSLAWQPTGSTAARQQPVRATQPSSPKFPPTTSGTNGRASSTCGTTEGVFFFF